MIAPTDRELLELAAKAAGLYVKHSVVNADDDFIGLRVKPHRQAGRNSITHWNPLTDDGDALRLAVKLRLGLDIVDYGTSVRAAGQWYGSEAHLHGGIESATRRAIVRAAAEIGKAMP